MDDPEVKISKYGGSFESPFRGLPAEIRMMIWNFSVPEVVKLRKSQFLSGHGPDSEQPRFKKARPLGLALLHVNTVVQREFIEAARGKIAFDLDTSPNEALEALPKQIRSIVGTIRASLLAPSSTSKYRLRMLTGRDLLHFAQPYLRFSNIHTIHVDIFSADWERFARYECIKPIILRQMELEEQRVFDRQERDHRRRTARENRRLMCDFRRMAREEDDESEISSDDEDYLDDDDDTLEARIFRGDEDAIVEFWDQLDTGVQEDYYFSLFGFEFLGLPPLVEAVSCEELSKAVVEFHDLNPQQLYAFERVRDAILYLRNPDEGKGRPLDVIEVKDWKFIIKG